MLATTGPRYAGYAAAAERLAAQVRAAPPGAPVRLAKRTSNLFRTRRGDGVTPLDVAAFDGVLAVDVEARTADVLGMTTYEHLVAATLPHGLMPLVVPQLKTITLGGAVTGLGIEASSFRNGLPHESVLEMDVLTGAGEVLTASPHGEHAELFYGFPNSYGTLGYALRLRIELEPVHPYVRLQHQRCTSAAEAAQQLAAACAAGTAAFVDGTVFSPGEIYLSLGSWADDAPYTSDYTGSRIYYRSIRERSEDYLSVHDYLWRWDTDWFWCSAAFGAQHPLVRRLWPRRLLRSDVYWRIVAWENRHHVKRALDRRRGQPEREAVIQDVEVPVARLAEFLQRFDAGVGMRPVWLCPLRQRDPHARYPLYPLEADQLYVNVGFWGTVPLAPGQDPHHHNRFVEDLVAELDGRKSLYSEAFYSPQRFHSLYGGEAYARLKARYDPQHRLLDLYDKCVRAR